MALATVFPGQLVSDQVASWQQAGSLLWPVTRRRTLNANTNMLRSTSGQTKQEAVITSAESVRGASVNVFHPTWTLLCWRKFSPSTHQTNTHIHPHVRL